MRTVLAAVGLTLAAGVTLAAAQTATPAPNPKCKDAVTAQARSAAQLSDASREKRAQEKAISNWGKRARDTYGWQYRFWTKAEDKQVNCRGTTKSRTCVVSAKPCRVL